MSSNSALLWLRTIGAESVSQPCLRESWRYFVSAVVGACDNAVTKPLALSIPSD